MQASVREFKSKLSRYLKQVAAGEEVTVTSHGRPVARVIQVVTEQSDRELSPAEIRQRLASIPGIILPTGPKPSGAKRPVHIRSGEKTLAELVLDDRR